MLCPIGTASCRPYTHARLWWRACGVIVPITLSLTAAAQPADTLVRKPIVGISTNALSDLAITPNVALEFPIGKHWSLYTEYTFPWWVSQANNRAWQIQKWDLGGRYWFGRNRTAAQALSGHFLGIDLAAGYYDISPKHYGWQGEAVAASLEYGYAWRLGKGLHWRLSVYVGGGWMYSQYRFYTGSADDKHLLYDHSGILNWYGPTKAGVSIQYLFYTKPKQKKK